MVRGKKGIPNTITLLNGQSIKLPSNHNPCLEFREQLSPLSREVSHSSECCLIQRPTTGQIAKNMDCGDWDLKGTTITHRLSQEICQKRSQKDCMSHSSGEQVQKSIFWTWQGQCVYPVRPVGSSEGRHLKQWLQNPSVATVQQGGWSRPHESLSHPWLTIDWPSLVQGLWR